MSIWYNAEKLFIGRLYCKMVVQIFTKSNSQYMCSRIQEFGSDFLLSF